MKQGVCSSGRYGEPGATAGCGPKADIDLTSKHSLNRTARRRRWRAVRSRPVSLLRWRQLAEVICGVDRS
jgi:hypothetical protein